MTSKDKQRQDPEKIISDEDFVTLMEKKYQTIDEPINETDKRRVWNKLALEINDADRLSENASLSPKWNVISQALAASLLLVGILPSIYFLFPGTNSAMYDSVDGAQYDSRAKGVAPYPNPVALYAYRMDGPGKLIPLIDSSSSGEQISAQNPVKTGDTVLFKVTVKQSSSIALVMSRNKGAPEVLFEERSMSAGVGQLLKRSEGIYGYRLEPQDKQLRFCSIAAENNKRLVNLVTKLQDLWSKLPADSCVDIYQ